MEYDLLKINKETITLKIEDGKIVSKKTNIIERNGFRRFQDNRVYQTSRLGVCNLDVLMQESIRYGGCGLNQEFDLAKPNSSHRISPLISESKFDFFSEALDYLNSSYNNKIFSGECTVSNKKISLNSSYGLDLSTEAGTFDWYLIYQNKGSGNMVDGYLFGSNPDELMSSINEQEDLLKADIVFNELKTGEYPIIFLENNLVLDKLLDSIRADKYFEKIALYSGKLGLEIFNKNVNLIDVGYDPQNGVISQFDGEGTVRENDLYLIKDGVLNSLVSDLRSQKKYDYKTTGNGLRSYNRGVSLNFKETRFKKRDKTWQEIIRDLPICLVSLVASGGESNDLGQFSTPVQVGYVFKYGQLIGLTPQITINTTIDQFLGNKLIDISSNGLFKKMPSACVVSEVSVEI